MIQLQQDILVAKAPASDFKYRAGEFDFFFEKETCTKWITMQRENAM